MTFSNFYIRIKKILNADVLFVVFSLILGVVVSLFSVRSIFEMKTVTSTEDFISGVSVLISIFSVVILIAFSLSRSLKEDKSVQKPNFIIVEKKEKSKTDDKGNKDDKKDKEVKEDTSYAYDNLLSLKRRDVLNTFKETEDRIKTEILNLKKWARVNLIIGVLITVAGLGTLFAFIKWGEDDFGNAIDSVTLAKLSLYWISKLSLVILIEVFAFFFLRVYKENMETIKYYHNELTSIESRKKALLFSILHGCKEDVSQTLNTMNLVDRNFVIHKEQTTVELEKIKIINTSLKEQIDNLWELIKGIVPHQSDR